MINCLQKEEKTNMKKRRLMVTAIILAMAIAGTGCGTKGSNTVSETKKETTVKEEDKKSEKDNSVAENTDKTQQSVTEASENGNGDQVTDTTEANANADVSNQGNNEPQKPAKDSTTSNNVAANNGNNANNNRNNNATTTTNTSGNNSNQTTVNTANNTNIPAQTAPAQHQHTWQHVEATGHYETVTVQAAWDEEVPVYQDVERVICNVCGADITTSDVSAHSKAHALAYEGSGWHSEVRHEQTGTQTVHHDAVTEQHWVQDTPAYDVCTGCGATR